jgi:hypothetical protein
MTDAEAKALREKWQQRSASVACRHQKLELESNERGHLMGGYHCTDCGKPVARKL